MAKQNSRSKARPAARAAEVNEQELLDGTLTVRIRGGALDGQAVTLDVLTAQLACEAVASKHETHKPGWAATAGFLTDMAKAFDELGVTGCSGTLAFQLWHAVTKAWVDVKKNMPA